MMKLRRRNRNRRVKADMNVVPYIDVMLVLLVIFMIAAPLINQAIEIDLPDAPADVLEMPDDADLDVLPLVLTVDNSGQMFLSWADDPAAPLGKEAITEITAQALKQYPALPVLVRGDQGARYADIVSGISYLQAGGAPNVGLSTDPLENEVP
ncbi:biopolymer transporter ExbD [Suttonella sp. R2A3]|uniref:biopolymer transporter ExbD n=1 Tax=Suttonella sp. R2A3 TaxID=2908648 RepID=UPI001F19F8A4|nr:biopolymer transporter ExbD [Suttonella sp. R2A3]UJF24414.1 biopolymer transporter ExbD [Suttonella sp. R2A3]